jgi:hypothetical protein
MTWNPADAVCKKDVRIGTDADCLMEIAVPSQMQSVFYPGSGAEAAVRKREAKV